MPITLPMTLCLLVLEERDNLKGFFDIDNLTEINLAAIHEGILSSCAVLVFLVSIYTYNLFFLYSMLAE